MIGDSEIKDIAPAITLGIAIRVAIEKPAPAWTAAQAVVTDLTRARAILAQ